MLWSLTVSISYGEVHSFPLRLYKRFGNFLPVSIFYGKVHSFPLLRATSIANFRLVSISHVEVHAFPRHTSATSPCSCSGFNLLRRGSFISTRQRPPQCC